MAHQLPPLPYAFDALEPHIDARTMEIHHDKHHATYLANLNKALETAPAWAEKPVESLLKDLNALPDNLRKAVRNQGGGYVNHIFFWETMAPKAGGELPSGNTLAAAINKTFGNFAGFKEKFAAAAVGQFGSGWGWLSVNGAGELVIHATANQDSPLSEGLTPLLGVDVWEHAYYLKYQNRRADYVTAWWNVVNWKMIIDRYATAMKK